MSKNKDKLIQFANDELIGKGNIDIIDEVFATDYVVHAGGKDYKGHDFIRGWARQLISAIPDIQVVKVETLNQTDNTIAWQRTLSGTHKAKLMGIPPTGQKVEWREIAVSHFSNDKISEEWVVSELAGYLLSKSPAK